MTRLSAFAAAVLLMPGCLLHTTTEKSSGTSSSSSGSGSSSSSSGSASSSGSSGSTTRPGSTSSSSGSSSGSCPGEGQACTPANLCDNGIGQCSSGSATCHDEGTANDAQTGVACSKGGVCEGTQCIEANWPIMPNNGGGVIATPNLILMTYSDDTNATSLDQDGEWVADGGYLPLVAGQYGVGNGTVQLVNLGDSTTGPSPAPTGTNQNPNAFPTYLQSLFTAGTIPADAPNNIYMLYLPASWADTAGFCQTYGGYHTYFQADNGDFPVYAILPNCLGTQMGALQEEEFAATHEIVEASTDPYVDSWVFSAPDAPWMYIGGEVADMCESYDGWYTSAGGTFVAPFIWSNTSAEAGQIPCQPWPAGVPYVSVLAPATTVLALPGTTAQVPITGWASAPYPAWGLQAFDNPIGSAAFATSPTLSSSTISAGVQVEVSLQVPAGTLGGEVGAAWILCNDVTSNQNLGAAMVGVTAGCTTSGGCGDPSTVCEDDAGSIGYCNTDYCATTAAPFSTCSSQGTDDGVCLPATNALGTAAIEICYQAGTLPSGGTNCLSNRTGDGGLSAFCAADSFCFGFNTPTCLPPCTVFEDGGTSGCAAGTDCLALDTFFGVCLADCSTGQACPSGDACYQISGTQSACFP